MQVEKPLGRHGIRILGGMTGITLEQGPGHIAASKADVWTLLLICQSRGGLTLEIQWGAGHFMHFEKQLARINSRNVYSFVFFEGNVGGFGHSWLCSQNLLLAD